MAGRPYTRLALEPDPPTMQIDDRAGDIEPDAQPRIGSTNIAAPEEALEDALLLAIGNTNTRVADCQLCHGSSIIGVGSPQQHADYPAIERELERIADQRANHLSNTNLIKAPR